MPTEKAGPTHTKSFNVLGLVLADGSRDPLASFQRLMMAGLDYKGQVQSGFGDRGIGVSLAVGFDFGALLMPGVVKLSVSVTQALTITQRAALVLHRHAAAVHPVRFAALADAERAVWTNPRPVTLMVLGGTTALFSLTVAGTATLGIGDPFEADETGVALGTKAEIGSIYEVSRLDDRSPTHYPSAYDRALETDVEWLLNQRVKQLAATWLATNGYGTTKGESLEGLAYAALIAGRVTQLVYPDVWDAARNVANLTPGPGSKFGSSSLDTVSLARWLADPRPRRTADLLLRLEEFDRFLEDRRGEDEAKLGSLSGAAHAEAKARIALIEDDLAINRRMQELLRRRQRPGKGLPRPVPEFRKPGPVEPADSFLHCGSVSGEVTATAMAKAALGVPESARLTAGVKLAAKVFRRTTGSVYQTCSERSVTEARVFLTQSTSITQLVRTWEATAKAVAVAGDTWGPNKKKGCLHGTMTYRSVTASWGEPARRVPRADVPLLPHGSGISLGTSITAPRLKAYATWCRGNPAADQTDPDGLEDYLRTQLRIDRPQLRAYFATDVLEGMEESVTAVLVEAAFEFTDPSATIPVVTADGALRPASDLFDLSVVRERLTQDGPDHDVQAGNRGSRLQVVRLRLRRNDVIAQKRSFFSLGFTRETSLASKIAVTMKPWANTVLKAEVTPALFRTASVGVESTFDFHTRYFGPLADELNLDRNAAAAQELCVPPVALFNN